MLHNSFPVNFAQQTFWRSFALSIADVEFTRNDPVIGADSIERVVRLTVFEAIPPFFPAEYVVKYKCP